MAHDRSNDCTSSAGASFASTRAEAIFVPSHSLEILRPKIEKVRKQASELGRDPQSIEFFGTFTPIVGRTDKEALQKYEELRKYATVVDGLVLFSGWTGIDISNIPLDQEITTADSLEAGKVTSLLDSLFSTMAIGSPQIVADEMERWIRKADLDGFNIGCVTTPGTFEDLIDLVIPDLRRRGLYPEDLADSDEPLTAREKIYGRGQKDLGDDRPGARYKYDVYQQDPPYVEQ
ncbi:Nitrilotriacetate monooxygenase component A/pristinamycin IIA synthase subunit A [Penicillium pulvis]|uniref:Nitrilotriacetate monooxygenase component A/pristinamycin IIA synthase subunit A n=1 Tax=Penicillium pulvis TaxID=1562058 RepID=UPI002548D454|nr:Nitrilotriacetate monooxygenase component A/pristinamycin IIA synthase subunit A [Penicillium pulvis]KAJ5814433.1 Nitrilotriacetate monooxygenase component A/pristinamycin IIA synthase subunit A [Penicillium pulvis]